MPDKGIRGVDIPDHCEEREQTDCLVIGFILRDGWPWSVEEIAREFDKERASESVKRLTESGLAHQVGDLVFPSRAARRGAEIEIGTI
ncbi:MAG: hypothetical protein ACYDHN_02455 [Solirubrobacteraceae bacterium]